jgi:hypothetical protein
MKLPKVTVKIDMEIEKEKLMGIFEELFEDSKLIEWVITQGVLGWLCDISPWLTWNFQQWPAKGSVWIDADERNGFIVVTGRRYANGPFNSDRIEYRWFGDKYKDVRCSCTIEEFEAWYIPASVVDNDRLHSLEHMNQKWVTEELSKYKFPYKHDFERSLLDRIANKITTED